MIHFVHESRFTDIPIVTDLNFSVYRVFVYNKGFQIPYTADAARFLI